MRFTRRFTGQAVGVSMDPRTQLCEPWNAKYIGKLSKVLRDGECLSQIVTPLSTATRFNFQAPQSPLISVITPKQNVNVWCRGMPCSFWGTGSKSGNVPVNLPVSSLFDSKFELNDHESDLESERAKLMCVVMVS